MKKLIHGNKNSSITKIKRIISRIYIDRIIFIIFFVFFCEYVNNENILE